MESAVLHGISWTLTPLSTCLKNTTYCFILCISEWHCDNPRNVMVIIGPKVSTRYHVHTYLGLVFIAAKCLPVYHESLLTLVTNLSWDFKHPLIGCSRHTGFSRLAGINIRRKWQSSAAAIALFLLCMFDVLMRHLLQICTRLD